MNQHFDERLKKNYPKRLNKKTGKKTRFLWNESYAINSVGGARLEVLIEDVKTQPRELLEQVTRENQD